VTVLASRAEACKTREMPPQIALLTPYTGGNLGDAAIQDAMIANMRLRLSEAQFSGVCLNCENFVERHGVGAFPLCGSDLPFYGMSYGCLGGSSVEGNSLAREVNRRRPKKALIKERLQRMPGLWSCLKRTHTWLSGPWREMHHCFQAYRFLQTQDLLIVSGGGQLDEEWGGAWGHPFALFKWAVLARIAQVPYVMVSVGAQRVASAAARFFMSAALRLCDYRSYRDKSSREIAAGVLLSAEADPVVPDAAFSMPPSDLPSSAGIRSLAQGRIVVAISPIAYCKPGRWPSQDHALYERYVQEMSQLLSRLLKRGYFVVFVWSSLGDDESVIPELLEQLDDESKKRLNRQMHIPTIATWRDFLAQLRRRCPNCQSPA
jgi:polysaccharide pyruvyl transferase WcaK-like protein